MRRRLSWTCLALTAAALVASLTLDPLPAGAASPVPATCHAVLSRDAYLAADLRCLDGGVVLNGNVTLDLRGHRLIGSGGTAITVVGPHSPRVQNGRIENWTTGVTGDEPAEDVQENRKVTVSGVTFARNTRAIEASGTGDFFTGVRTDFEITGSTFEHNDDAIAGVFTGLFDIKSSYFKNNRRAVDIDTGGVRVIRSRFDGNDSAFGCTESNPCELSSSRLRNNRLGVSVRTSTVKMTGNLVSGSDVAFDSTVGFGLQLTRNAFDRNKTAVNLVLSAATLTKNMFTRNRLGYTAASQQDGFVATLDRNLFLGNRDGIYTTEAGTSLKANLAIKNSGWGIYAPLATDLGHNRAFGNRRSPQCVGVVC